MDLPYQALATIVAALIAAFAGSLVGAWTALRRFRRERVFDRQLDWYEKGVRSVSGLSEALSVALLFEEENRGDDRFWIPVQNRHLEVLRFANEAPIYGTVEAIKAANAAKLCVIEGGRLSSEYEPRMLQELERLQALVDLGKHVSKIDATVVPIAVEARRHLGLKPLSRS